MEHQTIEFTKDLEIGLPVIDEQHKEYIRRVGILVEKCEVGVSLEDVLSSLDFLEKYAIEHFDSEEYLMRETSYPLYDEHKAYHEYFCRQLDGLTEQIKGKDGFCEANLVRLTQLTFYWFVNHIRTHDTRIAEHIHSHPGA